MIHIRIHRENGPCWFNDQCLVILQNQDGWWWQWRIVGMVVVPCHSWGCARHHRWILCCKKVMLLLTKHQERLSRSLP